MHQKTARCILIADRHHTLSEGLHGLLKTVFDTVVMVADETSLCESARRIKPEVAVVDLSLAPWGNLDWLKRLHILCPKLKLVLLSVHDEPSVSQFAIELGANAFVLKRTSSTDLLPAIETVLKGKSYISPEIRLRDPG